MILTYNHFGLTMQDMKTSSLTIRLDKDLSDLLMQASQRSKKNRSEIAREAIRRQLRLDKFEEIRIYLKKISLTDKRLHYIFLINVKFNMNQKYNELCTI